MTLMTYHVTPYSKLRAKTVEPPNAQINMRPYNHVKIPAVKLLPRTFYFFDIIF